MTNIRLSLPQRIKTYIIGKQDLIHRMAHNEYQANDVQIIPGDFLACYMVKLIILWGRPQKKVPPLAPGH